MKRLPLCDSPSFSAATAACFKIIGVDIREIGREELLNGEVHAREHIARIIRRGHALLVGNTVPKYSTTQGGIAALGIHGEQHSVRQAVRAIG